MVEDKYKNFEKNQRPGFIALIALLIVASAALSLGIAANLSGFDELKAALAGSRVVQARALVQSCVEDNLEGLRNNFISKSSSLSNSDGSCIINVAVDGSYAYINATGTVDIYNQKIQATVDNQLNVINWQED